MAAVAATSFSPLSRALVQQGRLVQGDANAIQAEATKAGITFIEQLAASKKISARDVALFAAQTFGVPLLDLGAIDPELLPVSLIDTKLVGSKRVIPLQKRGNRLFLGMSDPTNEQLLSELKFATGSTVEPVVVEEDKLATLIKRFGESAAKSLDTMLGDDTALENIDLGSGDEAQADSAGGAPEEIDDAPVVKYVQKVLIDAINGGASDIHFEPYEKFYRIRYRTDGILADVAQPPLAIKEKIASRIKVISRLDIAEKRVPQDGRMKLRLSATRAIDFRVSTLPTMFGEKICMRILDPSSATLGIEALGYEPEQKAALMHAISRPYGMVLVTGPTGSGKTVSLYTCLNILNKPGINISTAEDPCEINLPGINQVNVNDKAGLTFAASLKAFLRQDPDIIMVGEIRDLATAEMAVQAALTGHLVFSTLHTNDAPSAVTRLLELGIPSYLINATLLGVLAQRLVRTLCDQCKAPDTETTREALAEVVAPWTISGGFKPYKPVGCVDCRMTGFRGRMGLYELLVVSENFKLKMAKEPQMASLKRQAIQDGMRPLRLAGALQVAEGHTVIGEVIAATPPLT